MVRLFVRHPVADFEKWHAGYRKAAALRAEHGVKQDTVWQAVDAPNDVTVSHVFDSAEAAKSFSTSAALKEKMKELGVSGPPSIWIVEEVR
ncbi:MAG: hypothetical protein WCD16_16705 [Paracoccaceae bacterium]